MNTTNKIHNFFNRHKPTTENGNKLTVKVQKSVYPDKVLTFDQIHDRIHKHFQINIE